MPNSTIQQTIENYIKAYNNFDVDGMVEQIHPDVQFDNVSNNEKMLSIKGLEAFKAQALKATQLFTEREQKIRQLTITDNTAEAEIDYTAILAIDLPNGMKAGDKLELEVKSVFTIQDDKIIKLQDYS
ncbi:nuclear transport factor 2 family protein [Pontibacter populi]|uniref:Nuclear transport factor 2 family protein n=1 Tax=Pontibacter populi TaxID=890055 RepID=A0ABV1RX02_9BACT